MIARSILVTIVALGLACAGPYAERPPTSTESPPSSEEEAEPAAADPPAAAPTGDTVVGHVTPDGRFHQGPDSATAEPVPIDRRTVVTGTVRSAAPETAPSEMAPSEAAPGAAEPDPASPAPGYRVQIFAARDQATAEGVARRLEERVADQPVYVEEDDAWFKVRVGDFTTREEAEGLRARLIGMGYAEAWTARTTIRTAR